MNKEMKTVFSVTVLKDEESTIQKERKKVELF